MHEQVRYHAWKCISSWMIYFVTCTRQRNYQTEILRKIASPIYPFRHPKWSYQFISDNPCPKHDSLLSSEGFALNNPTVRSIQCGTTLICEDHLWEVQFHVLFSLINSFLLISMTNGWSSLWFDRLSELIKSCTACLTTTICVTSCLKIGFTTVQWHFF